MVLPFTSTFTTDKMSTSSKLSSQPSSITENGTMIFLPFVSYVGGGITSLEKAFFLIGFPRLSFRSSTFMETGTSSPPTGEVGKMSRETD